MRRWLLILVCFVLPGTAAAQSTSVSGTFTDLGGVIWKNGTYSFSFVPSPGNPAGPYKQGGAPFNVSQVISGSLDNTGSLTSVAVPDNLTITPSGSTWRFQVCPAATATNGCFAINLTITGASQSITSSVIPPAVIVSMLNPPINPAAYVDAEIAGARQGNTYLNLTDNTIHVCSTVPPCVWIAQIVPGTSPSFSTITTTAGPNSLAGATTLSSFTVSGTGTFNGNTNLPTFFMAGPGATPTIDQEVTACGSNPCVVDVAMTYTGPDSSNCITNSTGLTVYQGPNNVTVIDRRAINGTNQTITGCVYPMSLGGRIVGAINRVGSSYWSSSPPDSTTGSNGFNWVTGTLPSNSGAMYGQIGFTMGHDAVTIGTSNSILAGNDGEAYANFTSSDKPFPYVTGATSGSGISRTTGAVNIITSSAHQALPCSNASTAGAKILNCYGYDVGKNTLAIGRNYSWHGFSQLYEVNSSLDYVTAPLTISTATESVSTVTITTTATCPFVTGEQVTIDGVGAGNSAGFGYNGVFTVLTPGCNGTSTFTYTNPNFSSLASSSGGLAAGLHKGFSPQSTDSSVTLFPYLDTVGWLFKTNDNLLRAQINKNGIFGIGTVGCQAAANCFAGGVGNEFAGIYQKEGAAISGFAGDTVCGGVSATHTLNCSYNNDGTAGAGFPVARVIASGTATMTTAAITAGNCGTTVTGTFSTGSAANILSTDSISWSFNAAPAGSNAGLVSWVISATSVDFAYCPNTAETPAAATINWRVVR